MTQDPRAAAERIVESIQDQEGSSRRRFINRSVLAGGALLALGGGTGGVLADEHGDDENDRGEEPMFDDVEGTDVDVLNYALTLEHLENAFYREGLDEFDRDDFEDADIVQDFSTEHGQSLYTSIETIGEHEAAHVGVIEEAVSLLGGEPEQEASYDFGLDSVETFLSTAKTLENTGVAAYAGAAPFIESPDLKSAALSIHSVEARHAAFLNEVNGESPFPNAFDPAMSQSEVLDAVGPFITGD